MLKNLLKLHSCLRNCAKGRVLPINTISASECNSPMKLRLTSTQASSEQRENVYYGPLTPQIRAVKFFSLSSSVIGIAVQPILYKEILALNSIPLAVGAYSFVGLFTFVTPLLLHLVTRKYVTHLQYDKTNDVYIAKTYNFFCLPKELQFKIDDVKVPDVPGLFTSVLVKDKGLFFDPEQFIDPSHYARIMGYDKPIDFKLYENNSIKK